MTYRQLLSELKLVSDEQLDRDITIEKDDEYYPAYLGIAGDEQNILDQDHLVLIVK